MPDPFPPVSLREAKHPGGTARAPGTFATLRRTAWLVARLPVRILSALIWVYQKAISPALVVIDPTGGCRFAPSCSHYARGALEEHGLAVGSWLTVCRLAKCGPWHPGGEDPVPASTAFRRARPPVCTSARRQA